jgi:Tfp pilus assembly PilM family ATPase
MLQFFKSASFLALEINPCSVRLMIVDKTKGAYNVRHQQELHNISDLAAAINNYKCKKVLLSIPSSDIHYQYLPLAPELHQSELVESVHLELERQHPNLSEYYFDFTLLNGEVLAVTLLQKTIAPLLVNLHDLGLKPHLITAHCFLLMNFALQQVHTAPILAIAQSEAQQTELVIIKNQRLVFTSSLTDNTLDHEQRLSALIRQCQQKIPDLEIPEIKIAPPFSITQQLAQDGLHHAIN